MLCDEAVLEHLNGRLTQLERAPGDTFDERLGSLRECIQALPDKYREAIRLRYQHDLSGEKLAGRLSISLEAPKKRLQRSRARLLECLNRKLAVEVPS